MTICGYLRPYLRISDHFRVGYRVRVRIRVKVSVRVRVRVRIKVTVKFRVANCCIQTAEKATKCGSIT